MSRTSSNPKIHAFNTPVVMVKPAPVSPFAKEEGGKKSPGFDENLLRINKILAARYAGAIH